MSAQERYPYLPPISDAQVMQHNKMVDEIDQIDSERAMWHNAQIHSERVAYELKSIVRRLLIERQRMSASSMDNAAIEQQLKRLGVAEDVIRYVLGPGTDLPADAGTTPGGIVQ